MVSDTARAAEPADRTTGLTAQLTRDRGTFHLDIALQVAPGEVVALLGPNGAGKTTTLAILAGLLAPTHGSIRLNGEILDDGRQRLAPYQRPVGVVFQDYLLFPHLTVLDNVAFGLRSAGSSRAAARSRAASWLDRVDAGDLAGLRPSQLSGGQAQRVALARSLATEPELLLLDEPLAALDARTRLRIRGELRRHLAGFAGAAIVISHDPTDAAVLADRLVVIENGRQTQSGTPAQVTRQPRTDYVARLVGLNLLAGSGDGDRVRLDAGGAITADQSVPGRVFAAFRPNTVSVWTTRPEGSPRNGWPVRVEGLEPYGEDVRVELGGAFADGTTLVAELTHAAVAELDLRPGIQVWATVKASQIEVYPAGP